ncbi:hypothetical protein ABZ934_09145 [Streptomyces sp. NPDC046557]|uniref:hypothetical protein n=1 Tax=Streptomyces sp. NPDC046557 TaxID=3155372 RepID=UPI0033D6B7F8
MRERIEDRYELEALLGQGGFGEVWRARDERVGRLVAVKIGYPQTTEDVRRFEREASLAGNLAHPHIATGPAGRPPPARPRCLGGERLRHGRGPVPAAVQGSRGPCGAGGDAEMAYRVLRSIGESGDPGYPLALLKPLLHRLEVNAGGTHWLTQRVRETRSDLRRAQREQRRSAGTGTLPRLFGR